MVREQIAEFTVDSIRVLAEDGSVDEALFPSLDDEQLLELYESMKRARRFDERAIALQRRGEIGTHAPAIGQEAAQVGSVLALEPDDWVVPSFREQGAALARGVPAYRLLQYLMGMEEGAEIPPDGTMLPPSVPVGSQTLHAAGIGWAKAIRNDPAVALTYFGDGATSQGDVAEALNFAGVYDAQTVFFCQNNQYAISTPRSEQTDAETLAQKAVAAGIDGVQVDGNDVLGVYAVTRDALRKAREGSPVLVEALTYRRSMHTTSDDPSVYRTDAEEAEWEQRDPIARYETYLEDTGLLTAERVDEIEDRIERELDEAVDRATADRERIDPLDVFEHAYAELPLALREQLAELRGEVDD
ncbi:pyruvate dehydrogenase (acetyl-transferring) E1 component subunit alpha [Halobellus salinisoli]|uniref:pyruvate dehydrogenase (acetyl-transferring) E1 component subunit alpha n=1 Tax=Halobellus salinisoli TaxID=3108500 RepID=UPI00300BA25B